MSTIARKIYRFFYQVIDEFLSGQYSHRAASLAFTSLLSMVPLMVVSLSVLSAFPVLNTLSASVRDAVFKIFVTDSAHTVQNQINHFIAKASELPAPELIFLIATALIMIFNMEMAFNDIWHVKRRRHLAAAFLLYWGMLTFTPIIVSAGLGLSSYLLAFPAIKTMLHHIGVGYFISSVMPMVVTSITFVVLYLALPNRHVPFRAALAGSILATLLFELAKQCFTWYVSYVHTYQLIYGALSAIPLFFIWVYCVWFIVLLGGVMSYTVSCNLTMENKI